MRSAATIKSLITSKFISDPAIIQMYDLQPGATYQEQFSIASLEDILFSQLSSAISIHEGIVENNAQNSRPHTLRWYYSQFTNFLDGLPLTWKDGQFYYDTTNIVDLEERKIIDRCAVLESKNGELVVKVATDQNGLQPLSAGQLLRFKEYCGLIKAAGNRLRFINLPADNLKMTLTVYVDPSIIDLDTGKLLSVSEDVYPVKKAIDNYLAGLEFNGAFVKEFFRDELQRAEGVKRPLIDVLQSQYLGFPFQDIEDWRIPNSGYFKAIDNNVTIIYKRNDLVGHN